MSEYNNAEMQNNEIKREQGEKNRIENETERIDSEAERKNKELDRIEKEKNRVIKEQDRIDNEKVRINNEIKREKLYDNTNNKLTNFENELIEVNSQLAQNTNKQSKSISDFIEYKTGQDDWEMLQNCLDSVKQETGRYSGYVSTGWCEKVIFPTGDYKISKPLICNSHYPNIDFQGSRIMPTSDFSGDFAIEFTNIWNGKFSNLVLDGFDKHIKMYNNNLDSGNIKIDDVSMYGGSVGYDIECRKPLLQILNLITLTNQL